MRINRLISGLFALFLLLSSSSVAANAASTADSGLAGLLPAELQVTPRDTIPLDDFRGDSMAFSPAGTKLALADRSRGVQVIDLSDGSLSAVGHFSDPRTVAWDPNGTRLLVSDGEGQLAVYDLTTRIQTTYPKSVTGTRTGDGATWSPDGRSINWVSSRGILSMDENLQVKILYQEAVYADSLRWTPDGKFLAASTPIGLFVLDDDRKAQVKGTPQERSCNLDLGAGGRLAVYRHCSGQTDDSYRVYAAILPTAAADAGSEALLLNTLRPGGGAIRGLALSADGRTLAVSTEGPSQIELYTVSPKPGALTPKDPAATVGAGEAPATGALPTVLQPDVPPVVYEGTTLVPVRALSEWLGASVQFDPATRTIVSVRGQKSVVLQLDSATAIVDGQRQTLLIPAISFQGRTLVPLRFFTEAFGVTVQWDGATRTITLTGDPGQATVQVPVAAPETTSALQDAITRSGSVTANAREVTDVAVTRSMLADGPAERLTVLPPGATTVFAAIRLRTSAPAVLTAKWYQDGQFMANLVGKAVEVKRTGEFWTLVGVGKKGWDKGSYLILIYLDDQLMGEARFVVQ